MFDKIKNLFENDGSNNDLAINEIMEITNKWTLTEINSFLNSKKEYMRVPFKDEALAALLTRFLKNERPNNEYEIEPKILDNKTKKLITPERTEKVLKIIQKISKCTALSYKTNEIIFKIIEKYKDKNGRKEYESDLLPYYKMSLERILLKKKIEHNIDSEFGKLKE